MSNMASAAAPARIAQQPVDYEYSVPEAILLDGLMHCFCIGFVLAEGLKYWEEYGEDRRWKRAFVASVVVLSFLQTMLQCYKVWTVAVFGTIWSGNPLMWTDFFLNAVICTMCEAFYIRRSWKMNGRTWVLLVPMCILWIGGVTAQLYITITLALEFQYFTVGHIFNDEVERLFRNTVIVFSYWVVGCTLLDLSVAATLVVNLFKSKTGLDQSDTVVNRVILMTLETALLPSISMLVAVSVLHGAPNPGQHDDLVLFFVFITAKLYAIGLLRTLNSRRRLRQRLDSTDMGRTSLAKWSWNQDQVQVRSEDAGGTMGGESIGPHEVRDQRVHFEGSTHHEKTR